MTKQQNNRLDWTLTICGVLILIFSMIYFAKAQGTELTEVQKLKLTVAFQKAVLIQTQWQSGNCQDLSLKLNSDTANWNKVQADVAKEQGLPDGTTFRVENLDQQKFSVVPPKTPPAKPAPTTK